MKIITVSRSAVQNVMLQKYLLGGEVEWTNTLKVAEGGRQAVILPMQVLTNISNLLIVTNSGVNIVIYAMKDFKFRQVSSSC